MGYRTAIFDMDGTILDTLEDLRDSVNVTMDHVGYPHFTLDQVRQYVGNGAGVLIQRCMPGGKEDPRYEEAIRFYLGYYNEHAQIKTGPYPKVLEVLRRLKEQGVHIAVVSNKPDDTVKQLSDRYFPGLFEVSIGASEGVPKKPHPDSVYAAVEAMGVSKEGCVYVGDSEVDVRTAENAGLPCISVTWGFREEAFLAEEGAQTFAHNMEELYSAIIEPAVM